jgi:hypothetical protein
MTELEARVHITRVRDFYRDLVGFGGVNLFLLFVWAFLSQHWYFWPGWVILSWGALMARRALELGLLSYKGGDWSRCLPFLSSDWEGKQLEKLLQGAEDSALSRPEPEGKKRASSPPSPLTPS